MRIDITDRQSYQLSAREYTDEGFLCVPGKVARTGIQEYLARELQLPGDPNRIVRVMRLPEEVFAPESLASLEGVDVTFDHPKEGSVTSESYSKLTKGVVKGPGRQEGDFVIADLIIKDEETINAVKRGLVELSCGYSATYDDDVPEGADYEMMQRNIRHNHVALVDRARAGYQARLMDHKPKGKMMEIVLDSGRNVEIEDNAKGALIADSIKRYQDALNEMNRDNEALRVENENLKSLTTDAAIQKRVKAVSKTIESAKLICGSKFACDSMDIVDIERKALSKIRPSIEWSDKSDIYVQAAFDMAVMDAEKEEMEDEEKEEMEDEEKEEMEDKRRKRSKDSYRQLAADSHMLSGEKVSFLDKRKSDLSNSWKKSIGGA